ncbi:hypothetical protein V2J09_010172 [Rumex salicifolius]
MASLAPIPAVSNYENTCKVIHDSWARLGDLVRALATQSMAERRLIRDTYKALYGEDLIDHLHRVEAKIGQKGKESKLLTKACRALSLWMVDSYVRDAIIARDELEKNEPNYMAIAEIFVGRKSSHVLMIKQAYQAEFRSNLDQDIIRILVALSTSHKAHQVDVSQDIAKNDAIRLFQTGERSSTGSLDEAVVLEILSKRSIAQLRLTFSWYKRIYGHSYTKRLKFQRSSQFAESLRLVVKSIYDPPKYYAQMIHGSIKAESNADDKVLSSLARLLISRAEVDMDEIQNVYKKKNGLELKNSICQNIACGDYRDFLIALIKA